MAIPTHYDEHDTPRLTAAVRVDVQLDAKAPWIAQGGKYEFLLYAGREHQTVLARVMVTTK